MKIVYTEAINKSKSEVLLSYKMKTVIQLWGCTFVEAGIKIEFGWDFS